MMSSGRKRIITLDPELNRVLGEVVGLSGRHCTGSWRTGYWQINAVPAERTHAERRNLLHRGEERTMIKMRAERIGISHDRFFLLTETNTQQIFKEIKKLRPQLIIIDSIQTCNRLMWNHHLAVSARSGMRRRDAAICKETGTPVFPIGHITKDGSIAGPKILEHMVDTVLQFEGDRHYAYRILRTIKNRFLVYRRTGHL